MPKIKKSLAHGTTRESAMAKLQGLAGALQTRYGITVTLGASGATVKGKGVTGGCSITDTHVTIDLDLGLPASLVAGKIETGVDNALREHFA